jgi:SWI/SNF-related matrix-associated actin-dependent regulator of chromatin subfamily A3
MTAESDEIMMSDSFDSALGNLEIERLEAGPDLLAQLMKDDVPLPETEAPSIITTSLFRCGHFRHKYFSS